MGTEHVRTGHAVTQTAHLQRSIAGLITTAREPKEVARSTLTAADRS